MQYTAIAAMAVLAYLIYGQGVIPLLTGTVRRVVGLRIRLIHGRRMAVIDGDTIRFKRKKLFGLLGYDLVKGRIRGIDAPETGQSQGPASTHALRSILVNGGWHLAITCCRDVYDRELMWLVGIKGPVGLRMLWRGQAFSTTLPGMPIAFVARMLRRGMWGKGKVADPATWRMRNNHGLIR